MVNVLSLRALTFSTVAVSVSGAAEPCAGEDTDADTCASKSESYLQTSSGTDLLRQPRPQANAGEGNEAMAKFHPCPVISALIANGKVVLGPAGEWSSDQADAMLREYFAVAGWPPGYIEHVTKMIVLSFFGMEALNTPVTVSVPEWSEDRLHTTYTGIRLPNITGDFFKGACNAHDFMRDDEDCGKPGPHPVVFDELARRLNKSNPRDIWSKEDIPMLCSAAEGLFFNHTCNGQPRCLPHECPDASGCKPMAYRIGPIDKGTCQMAYRVLASVVGEMTTTELKALLTEDTFPAALADKVNDFPVMVY